MRETIDAERADVNSKLTHRLGNYKIRCKIPTQVRTTIIELPSSDLMDTSAGILDNYSTHYGNSSFPRR